MCALAKTCLLLALVAGGCKEGEGDRCNVNADCKNGLDCVMPPGATLRTGGLCELPANNDEGAGIELFDFSSEPADGGDLGGASGDFSADM
jgi:hypothetical protein